MSFRPRTLRRLGAFVLIAAILTAVAMVLHERTERREAARLLEQRSVGLEAVLMGDYGTAVAGLGAYLSDIDPRRAEGDFDARLGYAQARARISEPGERHLEQAGRMLRDLADDFPGEPRRLEALQLLMEVTAQAQNWQQLRRQCDETLAQHPLDPFTLRMRREALEQLGEHEAALVDSQALVQLAPADVDEQVHMLRLRARLGDPPERIVTQAVGLAASSASDPRLLLVLAVAYRNAGQEQQALACLRQAAGLDAPPGNAAGFTKRLAGLFDAMGEHEEARQAYMSGVLRLPASEEPDRDQLRHLLALRLWQIGELENALGVVSATSTNDPSEVNLTATRTLLLFEKGDTAQARQSLAALLRMASFSSSPASKRWAIAWHEGLSAAYAGEDRPPRERLEASLRSLARVLDLRPSHSVLVMDEPAGLLVKWTGDRYAELGELEQAMLYWRRASAMLPGWDEPMLRVAEAAMDLGLAQEAQQALAAGEARAEAGAAERWRILEAQIAYRRWLARPSTAVGLSATALVAEHQRSSPLNPETLAAHVHMVARADPQEARRLVRQRLELGADAALRIELAESSRLARLGMEEELLAHIDEPEAVLAHARLLAANGASADAVQLLEQKAAAAGSHQADWQLASAQLLSDIRSDGAAAAWRELAATHAGEMRIQFALLDQRTLMEKDSELAGRTIEIVSEMTGPTARRWRIERARWLLARGTRDSALDAAQLLLSLVRQTGGGPESVDARVLLARALLMVGSPQMALEHLEAAYAIDPADGAVGLRLVEHYNEHGQWAEAMQVKLRMAAAGVGPVAERVEVARRLHSLGQEEAAISLLTQAEATGQLAAQARALLAQWLHRAGRQREAEAAFVALSEETAPEAMLAAAEFWASRGRRDQVDAILSRLEKMEGSDVERHQARAACFSQMGDYRRAGDAMALSLARMPRTPDPWLQAATLEMASGDPATCIEIASRAKEAGIHDQRLALLALQARALDDAPPGDSAAALEVLASGLEELQAPEAWNPVADALLAAAGAIRDGRKPTAAELAQLDRAAESLAHYRPLHAAVVGFYGALEMPAQRLRAATRIADALPHDPLAQELAFEAARDAGEIAQARYFASRWQKSANADALMSAAALAEAHLQAGNYAAAHEAIAPYTGEVAGAGSEATGLLLLAAEIQAARGDYAGSWQRISLGAPESTMWRATAIRCAADRIADIQQASRWLEAIEEMIDSFVEEDEVAVAGERLRVARAWVGLGLRLQERAAVGRGRRQLEDLTAGRLAQNAPAWEALADAALAEGDRNAAETALRRALALNVRRADAANRLARLLLAGGGTAAPREAVTWATLAVEQAPGSAPHYATLGQAHLEANSLELARAAFESSLHLDERNLEAMLGLARVLNRQGEPDTAARVFSALVPIYRSIEPREPQLRADYAELEALFGGPPK